MDNVLGVIGILVFVAVMVSFAAGVTWVVVRVSPSPNKRKKTAA